MWLIIEALNKKENKLMKDIGFGTDDFKIRILNMDEKIYFDSDELVNKIKQEKEKNKEEVKEEENVNENLS
jgi:hypothetical protein